MSDLEQTAMERLRMASEMSLRLYKQPLVITYSGGKDSDCLLRLAHIQPQDLRYAARIGRLQTGMQK